MDRAGLAFPIDSGAPVIESDKEIEKTRRKLRKGDDATDGIRRNTSWSGQSTGLEERKAAQIISKR